MPHLPASPALAHLTILDVTRVRAGPTCVRQFADVGANVIKIETPEPDQMSGPRDGHDMQNLHRNKRSLTLDLKAAAPGPRAAAGRCGGFSGRPLLNSCASV